MKSLIATFVLLASATGAMASEFTNFAIPEGQRTRDEVCAERDATPARLSIFVGDPIRGAQHVAQAADTLQVAEAVTYVGEAAQFETRKG